MRQLTRTEAANAYGRAIFLESKIIGYEYQVKGGVATILIEIVPDEEIFTAAFMWGKKVSDGVLGIMDRSKEDLERVKAQFVRLGKKEPLEVADFYVLGFERLELGLKLTGPKGWQQQTK